MPGLVPGIHAFLVAKTWMAGTSPAMTNQTKILHIFRGPILTPGGGGMSSGTKKSGASSMAGLTR
jgi:hypothetical protein